jgi:hypothetical protein
MNPAFWSYVVLAVVAWSVLLSAGSYQSGKKQCTLEYNANQKKQLETVIDKRVVNENASNQDVKTTIERVEVVRWKTRDVVKRVPVYVSGVADNGCVVPVGFVRLHDLSASGEGLPDNPDATGQLYDQASGVELSTVASTVVENYGTCREEMTRFEGLQGWVEKYCRVEALSK